MGDMLDTDQITVLVTDSPNLPFIRGDARVDGYLSILDAMVVLFHLFRGQPLPCPDAADVNDDGLLQIDDVMALLGYLFLNGQAPQPPFPTPGRDPTEDGLDCEG